MWIIVVHKLTKHRMVATWYHGPFNDKKECRAYAVKRKLGGHRYYIKLLAPIVRRITVTTHSNP